jgi:hypothetical protein
MACLESEQQADIKETGSKVLRSAAEQEHCGTDLEKASWRRLDLPGLEGWHSWSVQENNQDIQMEGPTCCFSNLSLACQDEDSWVLGFPL